MTRRPTILKSDLDKVRLFLREIGARIASVTVEPGRVLITTTEGMKIDPSVVLDEQVPAWKRRADVIERVRDRLLENWPGNAEHAAFKRKWGFLGDDEAARKFSRLNPDWSGPDDQRTKWPPGMEPSG